jgi:hypothetical protein
MTPEGEQKKLVKEYLDSLGAYHHWPVQTGMGVDTLDCLACLWGKFWGIEVKAPGGQPTKRQRIRMKQIEDAGGRSVAGDAKTIIAALESPGT